MLYDPKWEVQVKADPLTLETLVEWLETQNPAAPYNFYCAGECMVGQWVKSVDQKARPAKKDGWGADYYLVHGKIENLHRFVSIANSGEENGMTFGAALERARAALARA